MAYGLVYDFLMGQSTKAFQYFGAHFVEESESRPNGVVFRLYAPLASDVSVIGDFNNWDVTKNKMDKIDDCGVFECFIPHLSNYQSYKFHFKDCRGRYVDKADPFAFFSEYRPGTCSRLFQIEGFIWNDKKWMSNREIGYDKPISIYEMHLGSWKDKIGNRYLSYEEIADQLIPYIKELGFTHVEIMPITSYPFDGSWGYQATGFYSVDCRYGNPFQLMSFVDRLHKANIGVILDFAPVHFANDKWALAKFDGSDLFEYSGSRRKSQWGSLLFNLSKDPVRSFLTSAMCFFLEYFHFDGIRVDAVSNIIYPDGNTDNGEDFGAIEFIKRVNGKIHLEYKGVMTIAEDSSSYSKVTKGTDLGGLGFDYKWDLGWMNDTLKYYSLDPIYKKYDHNKLTFSMAYFYSENFMLPFSHDEVVHGKGTLINKLWGTYEEKFAQIRNLFAYQFAHPGKKLNFMGNELASFDEWSEARGLPWVLKTFPTHDSISRLVRDLNRIYVYHKAFYKNDFNPANFHWLMVDNKDQSIFVFERKFEDEVIVCVFNMTPNFYEYISIPLSEEGVYEEIFNSDKDVYSGANQYNGLPIKSACTSLLGQPYSMTIKLASFGACYFKKQDVQNKTKRRK